MKKQPPTKPYEYQMLIDGQWASSANGKTMQRLSPGHDVPVGVYPEADEKDTEKAIQAARKAFDTTDWPFMKGADRAKILMKVAALVDRDKEELAYIETLESGKPISQALGEMEGVVDLWEYAATLCRHQYGDVYNNLGPEKIGMMVREPIGVVGMITPWNFPLLIISQKLPFVMAAGCTAVIKPSELTPGTTLKLAALLQEAGVPDGVVNVVTGYGNPVGSYIAHHDDVDMISFTGSTAVGKKIVAASQGNLKKVSLELGGKNPQIIFPDADIEAAVDAAVFGVYFNMGECCNSGSRLLLHASIAEEFVEKFITLSKKVKTGDPLEEDTKIGAIINSQQYEKIMDYIQTGLEEGAKLETGGERMDTPTGTYIQPTVFTNVKPEMKIAREEIFGPVLSVLTFNTPEEAIQLANSTLYGLSAGIWTKDIDTALTLSRKIRAGTVWVNCFMDGYPELSFGGYGESGLGRELGRFSTDEFTELKTMQIHLGKRTNWWVQ